MVVPDFLGFGRSDKPVDDAFYTSDRHRDTLHTDTLAPEDLHAVAGFDRPDDEMTTAFAEPIYLSAEVSVAPIVGARAWTGVTLRLKPGRSPTPATDRRPYPG